MNKEKQRIKIAEACGWNSCYVHGEGKIVFGQYQNNEFRVVPNYLNDLNAIHSAVLSILNTANDGLNSYYCQILGEITESSCYVTTALVHATASQRAESLLKTLGLWEDETNE